MSKLNKLFTVGAVLAFTSVSAFAADLVMPAIKTDDFINIAGVILAALAILWGVKKAIALASRA